MSSGILFSVNGQTNTSAVKSTQKKNVMLKWDGRSTALRKKERDGKRRSIT